MRVLVTGAEGSIGSALVPLLQEHHEVLATDVRTLDVTSGTECMIRAFEFRPQVIFHLAGAKHAPEGEDDPLNVARVNIDGTANILRAAASCSAKVILASTCKACDPETAYGASKLIAERMVLNAEGVVVRYFNVIETSGNVFRVWEQIPEPEPLPVTDCERYFITLLQALKLTMAAVYLKPGRYAVNPAGPFTMRDVAADAYPGRAIVSIPRRRGDRVSEPLCARSERVEPHGDFMRIVGAHDPVREPLAA